MNAVSVVSILDGQEHEEEECFTRVDSFPVLLAWGSDAATNEV